MIDVLLVKFCRVPDEIVHFTKMKALLDSNPLLNVRVWDNDFDNVGLPRARNNLLRVTDSEFVCFMDYDLDIESLNIQWSSLCERLSGDTGMVTPFTVGESTKNNPKFDWEEKFYLPCHFMIMRRTVMEEVGGFDHDYFVAYADWDFLKRLWAKGYKTLQHNHSSIGHYGFSDSNPDKRRIWDVDYERYLLKWKEPLNRSLV